MRILQYLPKWNKTNVKTTQRFNFIRNTFTNQSEILDQSSEQGEQTNIPIVKVRTRDVVGTRGSNKLRRNNYIPCSIYGPDGKGNNNRILIQYDRRDFEKYHRKYYSAIENILFRVQIEDPVPDNLKENNILATMREVAFHPVTDVILSVNFLRFKPGRILSIPVVFINTESCPGIKRGGIINEIYYKLKCIVHTTNIPLNIPVDVKGLEIGARIRIRDITFPEGVIPNYEKDHLIAKIFGKRSRETENEATKTEEKRQETTEEDDASAKERKK